MKFPRGKGQGAFEYLQTYAWAILVVLIVGVVLWQLGVFGPHSGVNTSSGFTRLKVLDPSIIYHAGTTDNALNFTIVNGAGLRVKLLRVLNVSGDCDYIIFGDIFTQCPYTKVACDLLGGIFEADCCSQMLGLTMDPGETTPVSYDACADLDSGESFVVHFTVVYQERVGKDYVIHYDTGTMRGIAE